MAIPTPPTILGICTEGLKRGGHINPSNADITNAQNIYFAEVLTDLKQFAPRHANLQKTEIIPTVIGQSRYSWPADAEMIAKVNLWISPTDWQGTCQATANTLGPPATLTLASSFSQSSTLVQGKWIAIVGGIGVNQFGQVINYNDSTKLATVDNWTGQNQVAAVSTDSTSQYFIANSHNSLYDITKLTEYNLIRDIYGLSTPRRAALFDRLIYVDKAPDQPYVLWLDYWADITNLDQSSTLFLTCLRQWQDVFTQGVAAYTAQRFDDKRFPQVWQTYQSMLSALDSTRVGNIVFRDF